jgi:hypothetical protein
LDPFKTVVGGASAIPHRAPCIHFLLASQRISCHNWITARRLASFPDITGRFFYVFSKTGSCCPVAPSSHPEAGPISGGHGSNGTAKHAFESDVLSFWALRHNHTNKTSAAHRGLACSSLEKLFPSQTFAPRNIAKP